MVWGLGSSFKEVDVQESKTLLANEKAVLLDCRKEEDFKKFHISGAISINAKNLDNVAKKIEDKNIPVICYCYKGFSSKRYCEQLAGKGFSRVYNLKGGFDAWKTGGQ